MEQAQLTYRTETSPALLPPPGYHHAAPAQHPHGHTGRGRIFLWGMGGTLLSAAGFVAMILFEQYNGLVAEMRADLKHFNEIQAEFVKKESFRKHMDKIRDYAREVQAAQAARDHLEKEWMASEKLRAEMARDLQHLRERLAALEGRQAATSILVPTPAATPPRH